MAHPTPAEIEHFSPLTLEGKTTRLQAGDVVSFYFGLSRVFMVSRGPDKLYFRPEGDSLCDDKYPTTPSGFDRCEPSPTGLRDALHLIGVIAAVTGLKYEVFHQDPVLLRVKMK